MALTCCSTPEVVLIDLVRLLMIRMADWLILLALNDAAEDGTGRAGGRTPLVRTPSPYDNSWLRTLLRDTSPDAVADPCLAARAANVME